jgi:hypothetical protein
MRTSTTLILLISLFAVSCGSEESPLDCGCNSPTVNTVPNVEIENIPIEEQMKGQLFYKKSDMVDGYYDYNEYNNKFWIAQFTKGCGNCRRIFIICNDDLVGPEFQYMMQEGINDTIEVRFSGNVKELCIIRHIPADMFYGNIFLKSID